MVSTTAAGPVPAAAQNAEHADLTTNSVLVVLAFSKPGTKRKVEAGQVEVDADKDSISVAKEILQSKELKDIAQFDTAVRSYVMKRSVPAYGVLKAGVYRLPLGLVEEVDAHLLTLREERDALIEKFVAAYPGHVEEARAHLRSLYDPSDYPSTDQIGLAFKFEYRYLAFGVPERLSAVLLQREREKAAADVSSEVEEIKQVLRLSFAELIEHAANRLKLGEVGEDGKAKKLVFRDSLVTNLEEFFKYFGERNLVGDDDLAGLVERAKRVLKDVGPQGLRDDETLRARVAATLAGIRAEMDRNLLIKPSRKFALKTVKESAAQVTE